MDMVAQYIERYNIGFPTFEKLFNLKKDELLIILREVCHKDNQYKEVLEDNSNVYKSIENDLPTKIKICSWSTIEVTPTGIYYKPEHGQGHDIVLFDKFFVLNI